MDKKFLELITNITLDRLKNYTAVPPELYKEIFNQEFNKNKTDNMNIRDVTEYYSTFEDSMVKQTDRLTDNIGGVQEAMADNDSDKMKALKEELETIKDELIKTKEEIYIDGLTKIKNRKWFNDHLIEDGLFVNNGVLAFIDINDFKYINDNFGHNIGDKVLMILASHFYKIEDSIAIRYAGDEFLVFTDTLRLPKLEAELEKVISELKTKRLVIGKKKLEGPNSKIKFSFGLVKIQNGDDAKKALQIADEKMYEDKIRRKSEVE